MLVTEQDAIINKRCPMIRLRRESRPFAFNRSHPGRKERVKSWPHKMFSTPALPDEAELVPMPGVGLHDVAMGDQRSAPIRAAQGILWLGRRALHLHCAVMTARGIVQALIIDSAAPDGLGLVPATGDSRKRSSATVRCTNGWRRANCAIDATVAGAALR
jgi:hypothetical protein